VGVTFAVADGPALVWGTGNGDPSDHTPGHSPTLPAYHGLARGIVRVTLVSAGTDEDRALLNGYDKYKDVKEEYDAETHTRPPKRTFKRIKEDPRFRRMLEGRTEVQLKDRLRILNQERKRSYPGRAGAGGAKDDEDDDEDDDEKVEDEGVAGSGEEEEEEGDDDDDGRRRVKAKAKPALVQDDDGEDVFRRKAKKVRR
jgi:hypothetical protein